MITKLFYGIDFTDEDYSTTFGQYNDTDEIDAYLLSVYYQSVDALKHADYEHLNSSNTEHARNAVAIAKDIQVGEVGKALLENGCMIIKFTLEDCRQFALAAIASEQEFIDGCTDIERLKDFSSQVYKGREIISADIKKKLGIKMSDLKPAWKVAIE